MIWRLDDAVPQEVIELWRNELATLEDAVRSRELARRIERFADVGHGACALRDPRAAHIVQEALFFGHRASHDLISWVIMPNHVHVVLEPLEGHHLSQIMQAVKGFSSKEIGKLLGTSGRLWQPDYFDRRVRDADHLDRLVRYLEWNPVKAGLCWEPRGWPWSSANPHTVKRRDQVADQRSVAL